MTHMRVLRLLLIQLRSSILDPKTNISEHVTRYVDGNQMNNQMAFYSKLLKTKQNAMVDATVDIG